MLVNVEKILLDVQQLLECWDDIMPVVTFTPVDPLAH
jgi:hypothetical protein